MMTLVNDIKYGMRMLAKKPAFTAVVVLVIGLGVGSNTAIFNALDQISMRALPVPKPHELVSIQHLSMRDAGQSVGGTFTYPVYEACRDQTNIFAGLAAFAAYDMRLYAHQAVKRIQGMAVSTNYFSLLGIGPAQGRLFNPEQEPDPGMHPVVIISDRFRQQQFGVHDDVIGKQIVINNYALTIVGVTPPGFNGSDVGYIVDVYIPLGTHAEINKDNIIIRDDHWMWLHLLGRLKPGITWERAQASLNVVNSRLKTTGLDNVHDHLRIINGSHGWMGGETGDLFRPLVLFMIAAVFVLLIASVNIATMQLTHAAGRQKEIAIRQALGAGRWRVLRQLLIESLLLALTGGVCGMVLAVWLDRVFCLLIARIGSIRIEPGLNTTVFLFALGISLFTGLVFGLAPALQMLRHNVTDSLKENSRAVYHVLQRWNPHHLLVVVQMAIGVTVLIYASLFIRSVVNLQQIDPGYDTSKLLVVSLDGWHPNRPDLRQCMKDLQERINGLPGLKSTCLANVVPLDEVSCGRTVTHINGIEVPQNEQSNQGYVIVSPEYFKTLNVSLLAGRSFTPQDNLHVEKVMVINDIMARQYWPNQNPLGKTVTFRHGKDGIMVKVIGVVKGAKMCSLTEGDKPCAYWPIAQDTRYTPALLMCTAGNPNPFIPILRKEVTELGLKEIVHISTVSDRVAEHLFPQHAITTLLNAFGLIGFILCIMGIYSVLAYAVQRRTQEIGIRIALGAESRHVLGPVLLKGMALSLTGIGLGLGLSLIALRLLQSQLAELRGWDKFFLYGVNIWEPLTFIIVSLMVVVVSLLACYVPAQRATKIDPMKALRYE